MKLTNDPSGIWETRAARTLHHISAALPSPPPDGRFSANQDDRTLSITNGRGEPIARASFSILGTWSTRTDSWLWAWANETADPDPRVAALVSKGNELGLPDLVEGRVAADFEKVDLLFGLGLHLLDAAGWYRFDISPTSRLHLALFDIWTPNVPAPSAWLAKAKAANPILAERYDAYAAGVLALYELTGTAFVGKLAAVTRSTSVSASNPRALATVTMFQPGPGLPFDDETLGLLAKHVGCSKVTLFVLLRTLTDAVLDEVERSGSAELPGLGTFSAVGGRAAGTSGGASLSFRPAWVTPSR
mgnify:CR=1 FL=1